MPNGLIFESLLSPATFQYPPETSRMKSTPQIYSNLPVAVKETFSLRKNEQQLLKNS